MKAQHLVKLVFMELHHSAICAWLFLLQQNEPTLYHLGLNKLSSKLEILDLSKASIHYKTLRWRFSTSLTQIYDFSDFPMPVYARNSIYIKNLGHFGYSDTFLT